VTGGIAGSTCRRIHRSVHPSLFAALSTQVVRALRKIGMIDTEGSVILDPRWVFGDGKLWRLDVHVVCVSVGGGGGGGSPHS
jgi:hypothetical protein